MTEVVKNHHLYGDITVVSDDAFVCCWIKKDMVWENDILQILSQQLKKRPGTFIDAGAFIGPHSVGISKLHPGTKIVAFEPSDLAFSCLLDNAKRSFSFSSEIHKVALGKTEGNGFMMYDGGGNPGGANLKIENPNDSEPANNSLMNAVAIRSIDSFNIDNVSLIKIDTEGQEDNVILGAINTIKKYKPVLVVEIVGGAPRDGEYKERIEKSVALIENLGYKVELISYHDYLCTPL